MWFIGMVPIPAPQKSKRATDLACGMVKPRFPNWFSIFVEKRDIEGEREIVIGVAASRVGNNFSGLAPALLVKFVLFRISPVAAGYFEFLWSDLNVRFPNKL